MHIFHRWSKWVESGFERRGKEVSGQTRVCDVCGRRQFRLYLY